MEAIGVALIVASIMGGVGYIVRTVVTERTKRLSMSQETPPEAHERLARMEARLSDIETRQHQLQTTQEWQQKLLERSDYPPKTNG